MNHHAEQIGRPGMTVWQNEVQPRSLQRRTVGFRRHHKDTLLPIIQAHILPGTCVMSDMWKAYACLKNEGCTHLTVNHSLNFVDPDTGAHTQRIEITWWGVKRSMPRTGISKDLFESYLQEWLWRPHYGDDPFGNTIKHIAVRDLIVASWRKETKYTASTHGNELEEGNQGEKTTKDTMKVFALILFLFVLI